MGKRTRRAGARAEKSVEQQFAYTASSRCVKRSKLQADDTWQDSAMRFLPLCFSKAIRTAAHRTRREVFFSQRLRAAKQPKKKGAKRK